MEKNIGFISTRFAGTDGVTLESSKWAEVALRYGHNVFWFGGELDRKNGKNFLVPEAHFKYSGNQAINDKIFGKQIRELSTTNRIHDLKNHLKNKIREYIKEFSIDIIIAENVLSIPMQIPLSMALTETIAETQIPTIAHHHDFYWERTRFMVNAVCDYINMTFPPRLPSIEHVVINSAAQEELAHRFGLSSIVIPNVQDFENPPSVNEERTRRLRQSLGLSAEDVMFLQPTRIVQRKGIEHALDIVSKLGNPRYKLVISHEAGDEGFEYAEWIKEIAYGMNVDLRLMNTALEDPWNNLGQGEGKFSLWDVYPHADFITFPSLYEGFGNAFLEALYFRKPMLINRYATFVRDIEPLGFDLVVMDQYLTKTTIRAVGELLNDAERINQMVDHNYEVAMRHYSYSVLLYHLNYLMIKFFGVDL